MCYAYIYALLHDLAEISVQLTYCNLDTIELTKTAFLGNLKYFRETFSFAELAEWFTRLTDEYKKWADFQFAWQNLRQASIKKLEFPYAYRKGQKELASDVYRTIARRKNLFIQAPTGVGKTISTVFPGGEGGWRRTRGQDFLFDGEDDHRARWQRKHLNFCAPGGIRRRSSG